jgi:hypothetical protein
VPGEVLCGDIEGAGSVRLFDRDIDAAYPGPVHADVSDQVAAFIRHCYVHGLLDLGRLLLCRCYDPARIFKFDHILSSHINIQFARSEQYRSVRCSR